MRDDEFSTFAHGAVDFGWKSICLEFFLHIYIYPSPPPTAARLLRSLAPPTDQLFPTLRGVKNFSCVFNLLEQLWNLQLLSNGLFKTFSRDLK